MADASSLISLQIVGEASCRFKNPAIFSEIHIQELVGVTIEDSLENNQRLYTTTAIFKSCDKTPLSARHMAFRLTSIDGKQYMIGTGSRPFPVIKEKNPFPEKPADSTLKTVTITWKSLLPMLLILK